MITVEPVSGTVGAVVRGVDLSEPLDQIMVAEVKRAPGEPRFVLP